MDLTLDMYRRKGLKFTDINLGTLYSIDEIFLLDQHIIKANC